MEKIEKLHIKDYIVEVLRKEIISGNLKPKEELTQQKIAEMLGVSRMPIREAFQALEDEGFLEKLPNRHVIVTSISSKKILNIFRILISIETEIIHILMEENKDITFIEMEEISYKEKCNLEMSFHEKIAKLIQDKYVEQLYTKLLKGYVSYIVYDLEHDINFSLIQLKKIEQYFEKRDIKEINNILKEYYFEMADILLKHWRKVVEL